MNARSVLECSRPLPFVMGNEQSAAPQSAGGPAYCKTRRSFALLIGFILLPSSFCLRASAQGYSIDWYKVAGGGGTSTGSVYSLSGTIGQPDASTAMTGGGYSVTGGFWSLFAVQTPSAPKLTITKSGNQAIVSWDASVTGWTLQTNANLSTESWGNYLGTVFNSRATNAAPTGMVFFRLKQ